MAARADAPRFPSKGWIEEELFFDGDSYYRSLIDGIRRSQRTVDLECYIFQADAVGLEVIEALQEAAARGVRVRLMVDGLGSLQSASKIRERVAHSRVHFKVYHPVGFQGLPDFRRWLAFLNRRSHRKMCVVDGLEAWVGSFNISEVHSRRYSGEKAWHDAGIRVKGAEILLLSASFEKAWRQSAKLRKQSRRRRLFRMGPRALAWIRRPASGRHVLLNHTVRLRLRRQAELAGRIEIAKTRVWLTTPYFIPAISLLRALQSAASHGADVTILLPSVSDLPLVRWVSAVFEEGLIRSGIKVYHYLPSILHSKIAIVDEWATVGSTNLNHRSLLHDLEVDVVVDDETGRRTLEKNFRDDLAHSERATIESLRRRGFWGKIGGALGMVLKYWM